MHSRPPICATAPQWWCLTAGVCDGSARGCSPSQCLKTKQDVQESCISTQQHLPLCLFMVSPCCDRVCVIRGARCHAVIYSHSSHPLITKSHKGDAQPLHGDAVLLSIELVCPLLFQLAVVLFCIHLQRKLDGILLAVSFTLREIPRFTVARCVVTTSTVPTFGLQCHPVVMSFLCSKTLHYKVYKESHQQFSMIKCDFLIKNVPFQSHRCRSRISERTRGSWSWSSPPFGPLWRSTACLSSPCACKIQHPQTRASYWSQTALYYIYSYYCTSLSPASSACGHQSRNGYQWQYSWGRPH